MTEDVMVADTGAVVTEAVEAQVGSQAVEAPVVPEAYEFVMPEGVTLDAAAAEEFSAIAKERGMDQAEAQKFADIAGRMAQRQADAQQAVIDGWAEQVKADKEIGGDKLESNLAAAKKALDAFGTPELTQMLNLTGLGNHPEVIRAFMKIGKATSEDAFISGQPVGAPRDAAKTMFPSMN